MQPGARSSAGKRSFFSALSDQLVAAADHIFKLSRPGEDGVPYRDKLLHHEQSTGKHPAELDGPDIPPALYHVWAWFLELDEARTSNGMGPNPITFSEIQAWSTLTGNKPRPHEIKMLKRLDQTRISTI